jgi:hypothetical protein
LERFNNLITNTEEKELFDQQLLKQAQAFEKLCGLFNDVGVKRMMGTEANMSSNLTMVGSVEDCFETYIVLRPTSSYVFNSIVGCIVNILLAVVGTCLNALVICVFWKTPKLRLKVSYFMIMVLSTIDLSVCVIVHPLHVINSIGEITETAKCGIKMAYQTSAVIFSGASFLNFFIMNCERFLSIVHPFFHLNHVTKHRCLILSFLPWIIAIVTGIAPLFALNIQSFITVLALLVIIGTFYIYVCIFIVARKRRHSRERSISAGTDELDFSQDSSRGTTAAIQSKKTVSFLHDIQLAKMYLLVVLSSIGLNLPNAVVLAIFAERVTTINGIVQVKIWTVTLVAMNSTMNCIIFFWSNNRLRKEGWRICKEFLRK